VTWVLIGGGWAALLAACLLHRSTARRSRRAVEDFLSRYFPGEHL
jgi:hypothetical protein